MHAIFTEMPDSEITESMVKILSRYCISGFALVIRNDKTDLFNDPISNANLEELVSTMTQSWYDKNTRQALPELLSSEKFLPARTILDELNILKIRLTEQYRIPYKLFKDFLHLVLAHIQLKHSTIYQTISQKLFDSLAELVTVPFERYVDHNYYALLLAQALQKNDTKLPKVNLPIFPFQPKEKAQIDIYLDEHRVFFYLMTFQDLRKNETSPFSFSDILPISRIINKTYKELLHSKDNKLSNTTYSHILFYLTTVTEKLTTLYCKNYFNKLTDVFK